MTSFGELVLVLGDLHIPHRSSKIPEAFQRMLVPNRMQHVICTGNLQGKELDEIRSLAPNLHMVAGDCNSDHDANIFPETRVVQVGAFRIGVVHGHQVLPWHRPEALERMRRKMNVDILVSGHTHQNQVRVTDEGHCFINPVSNC
jgi:vacuolar protein sorting-associated protein 29